MTEIRPTIRPTYKQQRAWDGLSFDNKEIKFLGFGGGAGGGKTWMACEWLITNAFMFPYSRWFMGRNELTRLKKTSFITFKKVMRYHQIPDNYWSLDSQNSVIKFANGSVIDLLDLKFMPSDPDFERFGSLEYTGGFIEEAGEIVFDAFDILKSRVGRHSHFNKNKNEMCEKPIDFDDCPEKYPNIIELPPKLLLTFNPSRGWLYRTFYKPSKEGTLEKGYAFIQTLYQDNPYTAKVYGEQLDGIKNKVNKARLKDGNWDYSDDINAMTDLDSLSDMFSNTIAIDNEKYMTIDVARSGEDSTVFTIWNGLQAIKIVKKEKQTTDITAQDAKDLASANKISYSHIAVDVVGVGAGVADQLKGCIAFNSNSTPFPTKTQIQQKNQGKKDEVVPNFQTPYSNLKTQCAFKLAEIINNHKIALAEINLYRDEIIADLTATLQERDVDKDGKKKIATKEDIKDELGRSPDVGDTILMRMWWELKKDAIDKDPNEVNKINEAQAYNFKKNEYRQNQNSAR